MNERAFCHEPEAGQHEQTDGESTTIHIGRDAENDVVLDYPSISAYHARILRTGGGALIEDLGSTNGTYLNEQPLNGPQPLHSGDRIRIGDSEFSYLQ